MNYYRIRRNSDIDNIIRLSKVCNNSIDELRKSLKADKVEKPWDSFCGGCSSLVYVINKGRKPRVKRVVEPWMKELKYITYDVIVQILGGKWDGKSSLFMLITDEFLLVRYPDKLDGELLTKEQYEEEKKHWITRATLLGKENMNYGN